MEVTKPIAGILSNYEVYSLIKELQQENKLQKKLNKNQSLATICYETIKYLEQTPVSTQNPEVIKNFMTAIAPFNLTKEEKLQILNLRPTTDVEIQLVVDEERLSAIDELIETISEKLPEFETEKMETQ